MSEGGQERTEDATPEHMKKVHSEGRLGKSQDLQTWAGVGAAAAMLPGVLTHLHNAVLTIVGSIGPLIRDPDPREAVRALARAMGEVPGILLPALLVVAVTAVVVSAAQGGVHAAAKRVRPQLKRVSPLSGFRRVFGLSALWKGVTDLLKTVVIGMVLYTAASSMIPLIRSSGLLTLRQLLAVAQDHVTTLMWSAVIAGIVVAAADVVVVMRRNKKQSRMTKREVKDEYRNSEGDPAVKQEIRSRQRALSRNRMIAEVANADVVVVNPTHLAVALRYRRGEGPPRVVAQGKGAIAERIKAQAAEHHVPVVEDIPLARALIASCAVGSVIPPDLYTDVARVLAFVMALRRRGASAGTHRMPTSTTQEEHR
jgi:flagellar biosynthetic protein FlhB